MGTRENFKTAIQDSLRRPMRIQILYATYVCPGEKVMNRKTGKPTKKDIKTRKLYVKYRGNQSKNLRKACNGYGKCNYLVDANVIGHAKRGGCYAWAYQAKYMCVPGKLRKRKGKVVKGKAKGKRKEKKKLKKKMKKAVKKKAKKIEAKKKAV